MAKSRTDELFEHLHAQGLRKRTAKVIAQATDRRRKPAKPAHQALDNLKKLVAETEDKLAGGPAKRSAAAKKAAATRKRKAQQRSTAAKQAARTRAKAS
jgi:hypothetical protein